MHTNTNSFSMDWRQLLPKHCKSSYYAHTCVFFWFCFVFEHQLLKHYKSVYYEHICENTYVLYRFCFVFEYHMRNTIAKRIGNMCVRVCVFCCFLNLIGNICISKIPMLPICFTMVLSMWYSKT